MGRKIADSVVVLTGASSGIGRGAALDLARRGAKLVLAARGEEPLREVAAECERMGAEVIAVPMDVADEGQVEMLAGRAIERFGRIDAWVNNAAVTAFGRFEEMPSDVYRRVIETNFFGYVYGARAAIPRFREQGSGVLINNLSQVAKAAIPYASPYVASKFALYGLSEALREELRDAPRVNVCAVLPGSIDTPLFQHAANYSGRALKPMDPVYDARKAISGIVSAIQRPRAEIYPGAPVRAATFLHFISPRLYERITGRAVEQGHFQPVPAPPSPGNVFEPMPQYSSVSGGWPHTARFNWIAAAASGGIVLGLPLLAWYAMRPRRRLRLPVRGRRRQMDRVRRALPSAGAAMLAALPFVPAARRGLLARISGLARPGRERRLPAVQRLPSLDGRRLPRPVRERLEALRR